MMKRALSILLCLMLVMSMAITAYADNETTNLVPITINNSTPGSTYELYRILESNNANNSYGYAPRAEYDPIYLALFKTDVDSEILNNFTSVGNSGAPKMAEDFYKAILDYNVPAEKNDIKPDYICNITEGKNTFDVEQGYYLIIETNIAENTQDTYSLYMMDTVGANGLTINSKESAPTLEKTVFNSNDSKNDSDHQSWSEHATYDIGDDVPYKIIVNLGDKYDSYKESYYISVEDTMDDGLVYNNDVTVHVGNINGPDITRFFRVVAKENGRGFTVTGDLKDVTYKLKDENGNEIGEDKKLTHNTDVVLKYSAKLIGDDVVVGDAGNKNAAQLTYQNNPYINIDFDPEEDDPTEPTDVSETPEDITIVHTVKLIIHKVDGENKPLKDMGFTLYKYDDIETMDYKNLGEKHSDAEGIITFTGLDEGIYKLVETDLNDMPFNKADDIDFHIHATYDNSNPGHLVKLEVIGEDNVVMGVATYDPTTQTTGENDGIDGKAVTPFTVTLGPNKADLEVTIVNRGGAEMPETGGMGTTLIYIVGGILVLAAVIMLVTKKRMTNAD